MFFRRGDGVVVEMIDDQRVLFGGQGNIEFKQERGDGGGGSCFRGEAEKDVAASVGVVEKDLGCQGGAVAYRQSTVMVTDSGIWSYLSTSEE
jgi:hypothetical protein